MKNTGNVNELYIVFKRFLRSVVLESANPFLFRAQCTKSTAHHHIELEMSLSGYRGMPISQTLTSPLDLLYSVKYYNLPPNSQTLDLLYCATILA